MRFGLLRGIFACLAACALVGAVRAEDHADAVDLTIRRQVIENFGASDAWTMQRIGAWSEAGKNKVADLLFSTEKGIGLSLWRFNVGGGINHESISNPWRTVETFETAEGQYDWSRQANERWFSRAAKERGVPYLLAFVNSPPGRMTVNGLTNSGKNETSSTNLKPGFEKQYVRYLCDIVDHFANAEEKERLVFNYISPVNEPQIDWAQGTQEGNRCSNADIKRIIVALHDEITARKLDVKIRALECAVIPDLLKPRADDTKKWGTLYGDYLQQFLGDPAIAPLIDNTLCYHDYSSFEGESVERDHWMLGGRMTQFPGDKLWMSEICILHLRRDLGMDMALDVAKLIHADIACAGASAWHWWLGVSNGNYKDGLLYTDWRRAGDPESIIESKSLWAVGNFSRFVRPGMVRVELRGDKHAFNGLLGSAYMDAKTGKLVLVYINVGATSQKVMWTLKVEKGAAAPTHFTPYVTSEAESLAAKPPIAVKDGVEIAGRSIVTLVSE